MIINVINTTSSWFFLAISTALWLRICPTVPLICRSRICTYFAYSTRLAALSTFNWVSRTQTRTHIHWGTHSHTHTLRHTHWLWSFCHVSSVEICNFCLHTHLSKVLRLRPLGCQSKCTSLDTWPRPLPNAHCTHSIQHSRAVNKFSN